jgi:hypothetical protein
MRSGRAEKQLTFVSRMKKLVTLRPRCPAERGNIMFMILIAVALIGMLTAVIMNTSSGTDANIDKENLAIRASEAQRYASELERAVLFITSNGKSEADLRFAHPDAPVDYGDLGADTDPSDQVFHPKGGGASYKKPPEGINDGSPWEFYGGTALPAVGSDRAELVTVLPHVTQEFCDHINRLSGQSGTPEDPGGSLATGGSPGNCVSLGAQGRFDGGQQFYASPNTVDESSFEQDPEISAARPALKACVHCAADDSNHYYHVLLAR